MSQTLDEFLTEARAEITRFETRWRENHVIDPEGYPIEMADGNEGTWWEILLYGGG